MVNELIALSVALQKAGIPLEEWHDYLGELPKASKQKPCLRIVLNKKGGISEVSEVPLDLVPRLRKYKLNNSNGHTFPAFNINPLYRIAIDKDSDSGKEIQKLLRAWKNEKKPTPIDMELLRSWMCDDNDNWDTKQYEKLDRCLGKVATKIESVIDAHKSPSLAELIKRTHLIKENFRAKLIDYINVLESPPAHLLPLVIHEGDAKKHPDNDKDRGSVSVFLEIEGWEQLTGGRPIANEQTIAQLNRTLLSETESNTASNTSRQNKDHTDAYGKTNSGASSKMPGVKLPIIDKVILRAMSKESPCQNRYGTIDAGSFQVGEESRKLAKGALEWLAKDSHKGKTWCRSGLKELVFIYPETLPEIPLPMAGILTPASNDQPFIETTKEVVNAIKGKLQEEKRDIPINVFALRKMDKARTKVVFDRTYTANKLIHAAKEWQQGCSNIPEIRFPMFDNNNTEIRQQRPSIPFPLQIPELLKLIWRLDGRTVDELAKKAEQKEKAKDPTIPSTYGIQLLMNDHDSYFAERLMHKGVSNSLKLFLFLADYQNKEIVNVNRRKKLQKFSKQHRTRVLKIPSILGLLLFKLNINKDRYMKQTPFLLGQLLKLSDEIHALYCDVVRNKQYPQQLIGNALLTSASESPKQALSTLCTRLSAYLGWAKTHRFKNRSETEEFTTHKKAGWLLSLYESVADQLAELSIPERFSDADRAQFLLGYLASYPKKEKPQTTQNNS